MFCKSRKANGKAIGPCWAISLGRKITWNGTGPYKISKAVGKRACCYSFARVGSFFLLWGSGCTTTNGQFRHTHACKCSGWQPVYYMHSAQAKDFHRQMKKWLLIWTKIGITRSDIHVGSPTSIRGMKLCDRSFCALHCVQSHGESLQHDFSKLLTQKYLAFLLCPVACCTLKLDQKWCFHRHLGLPNRKEIVNRKKIYASSLYMYIHQHLTSDCLNLC